MLLPPNLRHVRRRDHWSTMIGIIPSLHEITGLQRGCLSAEIGENVAIKEVGSGRLEGCVFRIGARRLRPGQKVPKLLRKGLVF